MRTKKQIKEAIGKRRHKHNLRKKRKQPMFATQYMDGMGDYRYNPNLEACFRKPSVKKSATKVAKEKKGYKALVKERRDARRIQS